MQFIKTHFEALVLALFLIVILQQCSNSSRIGKIEKQQKQTNQQIDSFYSKRIEKAIQIEGLRVSKRTLYDWNSVVRTAVRPDDRMNEYDREIEKLSK
jgi:regulator of extracellular matrix RemA (YlzA/DUF370 family)